MSSPTRTPRVRPGRLVPNEDPQTPAREPLTRDRVLAAALDLADKGGIEALTMRNLARVLGVEAMSLYHHTPGKPAILDGIVDLVVSQIELPARGGHWRSELRSSVISAHRVLRQHPWACSLLMSGPRLVPARLRHIDALLGCLRDSGLPDDDADLAYHTIDGHILGFTMWEAGYTSAIRRLPPDFATTLLRDMPVEAYPNLVEHMAFHMRDRKPDRPGEFEFTLDLILDSLERVRDPG